MIGKTYTTARTDETGVWIVTKHKARAIADGRVFVKLSRLFSDGRVSFGHEYETVEAFRANFAANSPFGEVIA